MIEKNSKESPALSFEELQDIVNKNRPQIKEIEYTSQIDPNRTKEQNERDKQITILLQSYVKNYANKVRKNKTYKSVLFIFCIIGFFGVFLLGVAVMFYLTFCLKHKNWSDIATLATVSTTMMGSLVFLVKIIAKYVFPENEENNITMLVKTIQENDLSDKKLNHHIKNDVKETDVDF